MVKLVKFAVLTDAHYSEKSEEEEAKWFPAKIKKMLKEKIKGYLKYWDKLTQVAFQKLLRKAKKQEPFDFIIDLGDSTPGTNQMGLITKKSQQERKRYNKLIANGFPKAKIFSLWGDHDTGYNDIITALQGWIGGRMSIESFNAAEELIGQPWFSEKVEEFMLLFLDSETIRESRNFSNPEQDFFVQKQKEQEKFIQECLENARKNNNKVILFIHDPMQLRHIQKILEPHKENIVLILAGHIHSPAVWKIYCLLPKTVKTFKIRIPKILQRTPKQQAIQSLIQEMTDMQEIIQAFNIRIIPAIWGQVGLPQQIILGRGGYAILTLNNDQFSLKRYKL